ncbi:sel1 repeat family protein [Aeromonas veronii]|uniref:Sel1 repeat family protein n=2 Tax=Aeromonas veronii TaxID=654 RepID=A0A3A9IRY6_AERVE|nr:sel1 repeat family protein [Aeromonas veronii]RKJ89714.1 sel1 repeat family protein [Aeromonas veronii]
MVASAFTSLTLIQINNQAQSILHKRSRVSPWLLFLQRCPFMNIKPFLLTLVISSMPVASYAKNWSEEPLTEILQAVAQGDASAQFALGLMYDEGESVTQDHKQAARLYQQAAEQGFTKALVALGLMYANGEGVTQDHKQAAQLYQQAATQGDALAQVALGHMYAKGEGVAENNEKAVYWWHKAAEQGNTKAQNNLGVMYANGDGVEQSYLQAYVWFSIAAVKGHAGAIKGQEATAKKLIRAELKEGLGMAIRHFEQLS